MILSYTAKEKDNGKSLLTVLRKEMRFSATMVRRLKAVQGITLNGEPAYVSVSVHTGDVVSADTGLSEPPSDIVPQVGEVEVLWENEGLIAVNKPCGMLVHPSHAKYTDTLSNYVAGYLLRNGEEGCCHAVNRLDRDTSGVVLFAKNSHFKALAGEALASAEKEYLALCCGVPAPEHGTVDLPIRRFAEHELLRIVSPDGQRAVTHYETLSSCSVSGGEISLLRLRLDTGRTHQIRVHTLAAGFPVLGDKLYRTDQSSRLSEALELHTQALHAYSLRFTDPLSGEPITVTAPIRREDFSRMIVLLTSDRF